MQIHCMATSCGPVQAAEAGEKQVQIRQSLALQPSVYVTHTVSQSSIATRMLTNGMAQAAITP